MKNINCDFCHSNETVAVYKLKDRMLRTDDKREFYLRQCSKCKLAYLNPQPQWDELEYFYGDNYYTNVLGNDRKSILYRGLRKIKRAFLGAYKPKFYNFGNDEGKFLDIGCGGGTYESYLIKDNPKWKFYGVEPSMASYQIAKNVENFNVYNGNLKDAGYQDNFFDVILMSHSLEHSPNPIEVIIECFRILKPGGHLAVSVPNYDSLARRFFGKYWIHLDAPRHLFHFNSSILTKIIEKSGFKIDNVYFEVLSGSISRSLAYVLNKDRFLADTPFVSLIVHYLIWPIDRLIELTPFASGLRIIAVKK